MPIGELLEERRHLLDVAHWMLGSDSVAEHVTDEAYREWYALSEHQRDRIGAPRAWLTRVVGSISLARLALSDGDRELQGPAGSRGGAGPVLEDDLDALWAGMLDALTPAERAALVLNEALGGLAGVPVSTAGPAGPDRPRPVDTEPLDRARHSLRVRAARPTPPHVEDALVDAVRQACADEDVDRLAGLLDPDAVAFYDGGGKVRTLTQPVVGGPRVARSLLTLLARHPRTTVHTRPVNGRTGLVARYDGQVAAVVCLDLAGTRVVQVWAVLNPDKLRSWNRPRA
ncbi:RNA polymerase sigma factor [Streptomyces gancidicus BKS 13-15]|uniref:RNA polymerase sigma factor n=2 Tax=Streptomyces pseudogriseolus TaxID=36817 RepID=M3E786_STREZ|nr:RNA polymerase sigma factor [Streptomyces gancidicus BKS 13-15]